MADDTAPTTARLTDEIRESDPRIDIVIRSFIAQRLGLSLDDPVKQVVPVVLESMSAGAYVVGAKKLLEHLDAMAMRVVNAQYGEDAVHAALASIDARVHRLTAERDEYRTAWENLRDQTQPTTAADHEDGAPH